MRRFLPNHATVAAYVALFVALGSTAMASVVISSNSQIGPDTVSGHKPPSGDHANIITGSVNSQDVADNSVHSTDITNNDIRSGDVRDDNYAGGGLTGSDIADNSLAGADIEEPTLNGVARKIIYEDTATASPPPTTLLSLGAYTLKASCERVFVNPNYATRLRLFVNGPGGTVNFTVTESTNDEAGNTVTVQGGRQLSALTDEPLFNIYGNQGFMRIAGTEFLQAGNLLVEVEYNGAADNRNSPNPGTCFIYGMATFGT